MTNRLTLLLALAALLVACGGTHTMPDAGAASDSGAEWPPSGTLTALGACGWIGGIHTRLQASGVVPSDCAPEPCPFPYDSSGRELWVCAPEPVEACAAELEASANNCERYQGVMRSPVCQDAGAMCGPGASP